MKITVTAEKLDINSKETKPLILRDINVGMYNYGDYSKLVFLKSREGRILGDLENYICGLLHNYFKVDVLTSDDVLKLEKLCEEKEHCTLEKWINNTLYELSKNYIERE